MTGHAVTTVGVRELCALGGSPLGEAGSPFDASPYLLVQLGEREELELEQAAARWLRRRPCPVIGIGDSAVPSAVADACDVVVADAGEAAPILANVRAAPLASMTFVQVLRVGEQLAVEQALVVESLAYSTLQAGPEFRRWLAARVPRPTPRPQDPGPAVLLERSGDTAQIRLNRPSRRNSLSVEMRDALCEALGLIVADDSIRSVRLSGNGPCFSSGGDLDEFGSAPDSATAHAVRSLRLPAALLVQCAGRVEFELHGACVGAGAELPAFGRRVRAHRDAFFQLPEIRLGLIPGAGGCVSIPRRIGRQRAAYMGLSAARIDAAQAHAWGLVDELVD